MSVVVVEEEVGKLKLSAAGLESGFFRSGSGSFNCPVEGTVLLLLLMVELEGHLLMVVERRLW